MMRITTNTTRNKNKEKYNKIFGIKKKSHNNRQEKQNTSYNTETEKNETQNYETTTKN